MCVKDDVDDKDVLPVFDRAMSILNMHGWWSRDPSNQIWLGAFDIKKPMNIRKLTYSIYPSVSWSEPL